MTCPAMWRSAVDDRPVTTPSWPRMPSRRCETLVLPLVPVVPNRIGRWSSRPVPYTQADRSPSMPRGSSTMITGSPVAAATSAPCGIGHDRDGALLGGRRGEFRAVAIHAAHRDEHVARPQIGRREGEPGQGRSRRLSADLDGRTERRDRRARAREARPGGARGAGVEGASVGMAHPSSHPGILGILGGLKADGGSVCVWKRSRSSSESSSWSWGWPCRSHCTSSVTSCRRRSSACASGST